MMHRRIDTTLDEASALPENSGRSARPPPKRYSFAHLSDIHIGAFRDPTLQQMVLDAFDQAMDICLKRKVDFIVLSGDIFDTNFPDMGLVNSAVRKFRQVKESGIRIYAVYGSHDFSPTQTSIIDVLESAGLFTKLPEGRSVDGKFELPNIMDPETGTKLCGVSGRKTGIESEYFAKLDLGELEKEEGMKIFVMHGAIKEFMPSRMAQVEAIPLSNIPKSFDYYAAGHLHEKQIENQKYYGFIAYPGALFGADYRDLEGSARGIVRGFFIATFIDRVEHVEFEEISVCEFEMVEYDATNRTATTVQNEVLRLVEEAQVKGRVVLVKVKGELASGRTSDIDFQRIKRRLDEAGARHVLLNYHLLTSKEYLERFVEAQDSKEIESKLFAENIQHMIAKDKHLTGSAGIDLSKALLDSLRQERKENETKGDYETRIVRKGLNLMNVEVET
jgi:DNA repair exonuclease SbcCD nuclease subunit